MIWEERKKTFYLSIIILAASLFLLGVLFATLGIANISFVDGLKIIFHKIPFLGSYVDVEGIKDIYHKIVLNIRLPRIVLASIVGMLLSSSGVVYQSVFKNPMADPYILGVSSGAALGATLGIILGMGNTAIGLSGVSIMAFVGAIGATLLVYFISRVGNKTPVITLILSGIAVSFFLSSLISLIMTFNRDQVEKILFWTFGSVATASWKEVGITLPFLIISLSIFWINSRNLNIMTLGEDEAKSLGIETEKLKKILLIFSSIATATAVSVSGIIGFVGLVIPHIIRLIVGPDNRYLVPYSIFGGAIFVLVCDTIARTAVPPAEIPLGIITSIVGAPYFVYLIFKNKKNV